jgi:hypothetical protein
MKTIESARPQQSRAQQINLTISAIIAGRYRSGGTHVEMDESAFITYSVLQRAVKFPGLADAIERRGLLMGWMEQYGTPPAAGQDRVTAIKRLLTSMQSHPEVIADRLRQDVSPPELAPARPITCGRNVDAGTPGEKDW